MESLLNHFRLDPCPSRSPRIYFDDDDSVGDGTTCKGFSLFWGAVVGRLFHSQGGDLALPTLTPIDNTEISKTVGRILAFTYTVLGHFHFDCIPQILCQVIFHHHHKNIPTLWCRHFYVPLGSEKETFWPLLSAGGVDIAEYIRSRRQDLLNLLREFNVPALPTADQD